METWLTGARLSKAESKFLREGIALGIRSDGRELLYARAIDLETGVLPQTNGSARVRTAFSATDVLVGVRLEAFSYINDGSVDRETQQLQVTVECSALARSHLLGATEATKRAEARAKILAERLRVSIRGTLPCLDIVPGKVGWKVFVDAVVFGDGGNLDDALSLATLRALETSLVPKTTLIETADGLSDFDIDPELSSTIKLDGSRFTLTMTFYLYDGAFVLDPTMEEESCADCALAVRADRQGKVASVEKIGTGWTTFESLGTAYQLGSVLVKELFRLVAEDADKGAESTGKFTLSVSETPQTGVAMSRVRGFGQF